MSVVGAETLIPVLEDLEAYEEQATAQNEKEASYSAKITKEMAEIDWSSEAVVIERLIRTLDPQPGAYTMFEGKRLKIWSADVVPGNDAAPGTILAVTKKYFTVQTGKDAICIREVQPESRKRMASAQFLQGCKMNLGDRI